MQSFLVALAFLTIIPIRFRELPDEQTVARSRFWYPVVGLLLGALLGGWTLAVAQFAPPMIGAFMVLAAWVLLTGALHLDGFCDLCDGLFGGATPEDRLRIMKEPTRGSFAIVGCVLLLLGKFAVLTQLLTTLAKVPLEAAVLVALTVALARSMIAIVAAGAKYPRPTGTGKLLIEATRPWEAGAALVVVALLSVLGAWGLLSVRGLASPMGVCWLGAFSLAMWASPAMLALLVLRRLCQHRLGGITGDCLGAGIETAELIFLLLAALFQAA